jgi:hypothetical protein
MHSIAWILGTILVSACAAAPLRDGAVAPRAGGPPDQFEPAGSLRLEQISVALRVGAVELRLTPLEQRVLRLAAPDLRNRLQTLAAESKAYESRERTPLLVTFTSTARDHSFSPTELRLEVGSRRLEVLEVIPVTPGWDEQRLRPREPAAALFIVGGRLDAFAPFRVLYGGTVTDGWRDVIPVLQAEERRVGSMEAGR